MSEKNILNVHLKLKTIGYLLIPLGIALFFIGLADVTWYAVYLGTPKFDEAAIETAFYLTRDAACFVAGITSWIISAKLLQVKAD